MRGWVKYVWDVGKAYRALAPRLLCPPLPGLYENYGRLRQGQPGWPTVEQPVKSATNDWQGIFEYDREQSSPMLHMIQPARVSRGSVDRLHICSRHSTPYFFSPL